MQSIAESQLFQTIFDHASIGIIVVDAKAEIISINRFALQQFGYAEREEVFGSKIEVLIPARFHHRHEKHRDGYLHDPKNRPMGIGLDLFAVKKDGSEFPVEIGINPVETGEGPMILSVILDLSERKQSEKRIQDALQQKDLLLKEVHHRVKNNLQVIHSLLDLQALKISDTDMVDLLRDMPRDVHRLLQSARRGKLQMHIEVDTLRAFGEQVDRAANRLTMGIITASLVIGSSIVMNSVGGGVSNRWLMALGVLGFVGAALCDVGPVQQGQQLQQGRAAALEQADRAG